MEIKDYTEVLNSQQIDTIVDTIKEVEQEYDNYLDSDRIEIKFGQFIDGVCLIYVDTSWDENSSKGIASYIVNKEGHFLGITINDIFFDGLRVYQPDKNVTLNKISFQRIYNVEPDDFKSTDNYNILYWKEKLPTNNIVFSVKYSNGDKRDEFWVEVKDYNDLIDRTRGSSSHFKSGLLFVSEDNNTLICKQIYEGQIDTFTNIAIGNRYLLLMSKLKYDYPWDNYDDFSHFFPKILFDDAYEPRYGLFDLDSLKVKIHCGELDYLAGYINGFRKIEFRYGQIYTYDKFDLSKGNGVLYSQRMVVPQKKNNKICDPINVISYPNKKLEENTSQNTGPLYIVRSGKEAGRNISWLKYNKPNSLLKYVSSGNIHIAFMLMFVREGLSKSYKKKLLIANDLHNEFLDIFTPDDILFPEYINSVHMGLLMTYSNHKSFEKLVDYDVDYVKILIKNRSLYIHSNVFEILRERKINDIQYLQKLDSIQSLLSEIRDEDERRVEDDDSDDYGYWQEEEERRFYENEGYRDAYDGNPDAVWNND